MKKFLPYILILVVLVGVFGPTEFINSQSIFSLDVAGFIQSAVVSLANAILILLSWITGFAGAILDFVLTFTIVDMRVNVFGDGTPANPGITGINTAWKIIKDLMNIAFIFILLYESIKIIIGQGSVESVKRFVLGIVLASLLINFSLFFTKVLIDASNIVTIGVYRSILSTPVTPPQPGQPPRSNSIATILLNKLRLQTIYSTSNPDLSSNGIGGALIFLIGSSTIFLITAFILFAITANFIIRYITLIILLVLSPIAYMGIALSAVQPYQKKWWESLKGQLIFAPVFMIMLMIVITLVSSTGFVSQANFSDLLLNTTTNPSTTTAGANNSGAATASTTVSGLVLNFAVIIGLLIATLTVSKGLAKKGADQIGAATSKLTGYAGGMFMGGAGRLGRGTIGRWGNNTANDEDLKDRAAKGDMRARLKLSAANKLATSSFDARATDTFGALAKAGGVGGDFGKVDPKKTNFRAILKKEGEDQKAYAKTLKSSDAVYIDAKNKDTKAKDAETRLNSPEFKSFEENRWRETDEGKNAITRERELNDAIRTKTESGLKIEENTKKIKELQKKLDWTESQEEKEKIKAQMKSLDDESKIKENEFASMDKIVDERRKLVEDSRKKRDEFKSREREDLESLVRLGKDNESNLNEAFKNRVSAYAERYEQGGVLNKYGSMIAKVSGAALGGGLIGGVPGAIVAGSYVYGTSSSPSVTRKSERMTVAKEIRGATSEKKKISKKVLKEEFGYDVEDDKDEDKNEDKTKEEEKPKDENATKNT